MDDLECTGVELSAHSYARKRFARQLQSSDRFNTNESTYVHISCDGPQITFFKERLQNRSGSEGQSSCPPAARGLINYRRRVPFDGHTNAHATCASKRSSRQLLPLFYYECFDFRDETRLLCSTLLCIVFAFVLSANSNELYT